MQSLFILLILVLVSSLNKSEEGNMGRFRELTPEEAKVILHKGTETPFSGKYWKSKDAGIYKCKQCSAPLYSSEHKFDSHCGWPSFDDEFPNAVKRIPDADGLPLPGLEQLPVPSFFMLDNCCCALFNAS